MRVLYQFSQMYVFLEMYYNGYNTIIFIFEYSKLKKYTKKVYSYNSLNTLAL